MKSSAGRRHVGASKGQITPIYIITSFQELGLMRLRPARAAAAAAGPRGRASRGMRDASLGLYYMKIIVARRRDFMDSRLNYDAKGRSYRCFVVNFCNLNNFNSHRWDAGAKFGSLINSLNNSQQVSLKFSSCWFKF